MTGIRFSRRAERRISDPQILAPGGVFAIKRVNIGE